MADVANLITVIIIGEQKKLLLKARLPFHFFLRPKSESSIMEQFVWLAENSVLLAAPADKEVQCKNCYQVAKFGRHQEAIYYHSTDRG